MYLKLVFGGFYCKTESQDVNNKYKTSIFWSKLIKIMCVTELINI